MFVDMGLTFVLQCHGQQIFPAENMVAAFLGSNTALYAIASTASDAQLYLEALEKGADGIVLHTDDITEVFALKVRVLIFHERIRL